MNIRVATCATGTTTTTTTTSSENVMNVSGCRACLITMTLSWSSTVWFIRCPTLTTDNFYNNVRPALLYCPSLPPCHRLFNLVAKPSFYWIIGLLLQMSRSVATSACFACTGEPCKNGWTNQEIVWGLELGRPEQGMQIPPQERAVLTGDDVGIFLNDDK